MRAAAGAAPIFSRNGEKASAGQSAGFATRRAINVIRPAVRAIWKLLSQPGLMNLDFADFRNVVRQCGGSLVMATAEAEGENRAQAILENFRHSALLEQGDVLGRARGLLVGVIGGPDMTLNELQRVVGGITESTRTDVPMHLGTSIDHESRGRISVTVRAAEHLGGPAPESGEVSSAASAGETPGAPVPEPPAPAEPAGEPKPAKGRGRKAVQPNLPLDGTVGRGRFVNVHPTLYEGQDLDVPTYLRRKIKLSTSL